MSREAGPRTTKFNAEIPLAASATAQEMTSVAISGRKLSGEKAVENAVSDDLNANFAIRVKPRITKDSTVIGDNMARISRFRRLHNVVE